jgi:hypothetical protein
MRLINKFELHYYLKDESHQINAFLKNKCEAELLAIIAEISEVLDIEAEPVATAAKEGGYRAFLDFVKGNTNEISLVIQLAVALIVTVPLLYESENEQLEKKLNKLKIEEAELNIEKLRREIKASAPSSDMVEKTAKHLSKNLKIIKRKSNLYSALSKKQEVMKVGFTVLDSGFIPYSEEQQVERSNFRKYILNSNKLKPEEIETKIEIVSPVLKEGKYKWKGIYNDQPIGFDMLDPNFKNMVLLDNIPFRHGSSILCILHISRELNEVGDIKVTGYAVTTVIEKIDGSTSVETQQGKKYRHTKKLMDGQGSLFS